MICLCVFCCLPRFAYGEHRDSGPGLYYRDPDSLNDIFSSSDDWHDDNSDIYDQINDLYLCGTKSFYAPATSILKMPEINEDNIFSTFCLNIRSLANNKNFDNLKCLIDSMHHYPNLIRLKETWLKIDSSGAFLNFQNYNFISSSRSNSRGGGVGF